MLTTQSLTVTARPAVTPRMERREPGARVCLPTRVLPRHAGMQRAARRRYREHTATVKLTRAVP